MKHEPSRLLPLALLLWGCGGAGQAPPPESPESLLSDDATSSEGSGDLQQGEKALSDGDFEAARGIFERLSRERPDSARVHYYLGVAQAELGEGEAAVASFEKALALDPKLTEAAINLSAALLDAGAAERSLVVVESALGESPGEKSLLFNRALALEALEREDDASAAYQAALSADPESEAARYAYAEALVGWGRGGEALEQLGQLATSQTLEVLASSARLLGKLKEFDRCVAVLTRALGMREAPELYVDRGLCKHGKHDEDGARADFEAAVAKDANFAPGHYYLGMHYLGLGNQTKARAALSRAAEAGRGARVGQAAQRALEGL